jgi:hypothetical protein
LATTAFLYKNEKLRHSPGRPSRSDFVQSEFVDLVSLIFRAKEGKNIMTIEEIYTIELEN